MLKIFKKIKNNFVHKCKRPNSGLTLIETVIALAVFAILIVIVLSIILTIVKNERVTRKVTNVVDGVSFILDDMTRTIKNGSNYHCGGGPNWHIPADCGGGDNTFAVEPESGDPLDNNDQVVYQHTPVGGGRWAVYKSIDSGANFYPLNSPDIDIEYLTFRVIGETAGPPAHPRVQVLIGANTYPDINNREIALQFQTTFNQLVDF